MMQSNSNPMFTVIIVFISLFCLDDKSSSYCLFTYETMKVKVGLDLLKLTVYPLF